MHTLRLTLSAALLLFASCGDPEPTQSSADSLSDSVIVTIDTLPVDTVPPQVVAFKMRGDTIVPADPSLMFYSFTKKMLVNKHKALTVRQVRACFAPLDSACESEAAWTFQRFFYLDSLKRIGESPDTDMGQTVFVEIREYDTIKRSPSETWIAWTMVYETAQSCPYASGTFFMLSTYDATGKLVSTQCMGRDCGGADAPLQWVSVQTCNVFTDGSFRALLCDTSADDDFHVAQDISIMRKTYTGMIAAGGKITMTEEEIERNE